MNSTALRATLSWLALTLSCAPASEAEPGASRPRGSVLLVTLGATRPDALTPYGAPQKVTPHLAKLAQQSLVFWNALSVAPVSAPAHASMMTGLFPPRHTVRDDLAGSLPAAADTLAELAAEAGHETAAFLGSTVFDESSGFGQGFDLYDLPARSLLDPNPGRAERRAGEVLDRAVAWLEARPDAGRPFFAWIQFSDPNLPYAPAPEHMGRTPGNPYSAEVAACDDALGRILAALPPSVSVLVLADHGEAFGEKDERAHGFFTNSTTLRIPLLLKLGSGSGPGRSDALAGSVDVYPTVLELLGVEAPLDVDGFSLLKANPDRGLYFESYKGFLSFGWSPLVGWVDADGKYVHSSEPAFFAGSDKNDVDERIASSRDQVPAYVAKLMEVLAKPRLKTDGVVLELPDPFEADHLPSPRSGLAELNELIEASLLLENGKVDQAQALYARHASANPRSREAREGFALTLIHQGDHAAAVPVLERLLEEAPLRAHLWYLLGISLIELERMEPGAQALEQALLLDSNHVQALGALVFARTQLGDSQGAETLKEKIRALGQRGRS